MKTFILLPVYEENYILFPFCVRLCLIYNDTLSDFHVKHIKIISESDVKVIFNGDNGILGEGLHRVMCSWLK